MLLGVLETAPTGYLPADFNLPLWETSHTHSPSEFLRRVKKLWLFSLF